jgi:hypothetical protein
MGTRKYDKNELMEAIPVLLTIGEVNMTREQQKRLVEGIIDSAKRCSKLAQECQNMAYAAKVAAESCK